MLRRALVIAASLTFAGCSGPSTAAPGPVPALVKVGPASGVSIPPSFLGLSIEWDSITPYTGPAHERRTALLRILEPLARAQGSPLALRIGGDTTDQAWWNPSGRPHPPTVLEDLTPSTVDAVAWLARGLGGPVTLGVNLALRDPSNALKLARSARARLPAGALEAIEIGNEPDLYTTSRTFHVPGHTHRRLRKRARYGPADYVSDVLNYVRVFAAGHLRPKPGLVVGGFAGPAWWPTLPALLRHGHSQLNVVAGHLYAVPRCGGRPVEASWLTTAAASRGRARTLGPLVAVGRRFGVPVYVDELNSAACGGRPRLSDGFGSALWLTDTLFALARQGIARADVHTWNHARYAPFAVAGDTASARPELAGMLAFATAAPTGSRLVQARVVGRNDVRAWATRDEAGTTRVAVIAPHGGRIGVAIDGTRCGTLLVLRAVGTARSPDCRRAGRFPMRLGRPAIAVLTVPAM